MSEITRRDFLKLGLGATATALGVDLLRPREQATAAGIHPNLQPAGEERRVTSVCGVCPCGCGLQVRVVDGRAVKIEGNPVHPINSGSLCPKGHAALEMLYHPDRILQPLKRSGPKGSNEWEPISWEQALQEIGERLKALREQGLAHTVAFLIGEAQGTTADLWERFVAAYGSPNLISEHSLGADTAFTATFLTQGVREMPVYDLEKAQFVLNFGAALFEAGRLTQRYIAGVAYMRRGRPTRGKMVTIDPRQSVTAMKSDEWIPIRPGTDAALALGMARFIVQSDLYDRDFVHNHTFGFEDFVDQDGAKHLGFRSLLMRDYDLNKVAEITGVPTTTIMRLAGEFASSRPAVAILPVRGGLLNGSPNGLYTAMAIHALNALVGAIGCEGGVLVQQPPPRAPLPPLPDDPVAAEGRAQVRLDYAGTRYHPLARSAYAEVADRVLTDNPYPINALFLYHTDPVYRTPRGDAFAQALAKVPLVVAITSFPTESTPYADYILPEPTFLERWEDVPVEGIGYPALGLRQPVIEPRGDTLQGGEMLIRLAKAIGGGVARAFPWPDFVSLLRARLKLLRTDWEVLSTLGVWVNPVLSYPVPGGEGWDGIVGRDRTSESARDGRFDFFSRELRCALIAVGADTADKIAELGVQEADNDRLFLPHYEPPPQSAPEAEYPFTLVSYQLMALGDPEYSANLPSLMDVVGMHTQVRWDSWVEIHPHAAQELGIRDGDRVWVESPTGRIQTRARLCEGIRPDVVAIPDGMGHTTGRFAAYRGVNPNTILVGGVDGLTGTAAYRGTRVKVYPA